MSNEVAVVLTAHESACVVRRLGSVAPIYATLSQVLRTSGITVSPGDLVGVDFSTDAPSVLDHWWSATVVALNNDRAVILRRLTGDNAFLTEAAWTLPRLVPTLAEGHQVFLDASHARPVVVDLAENGEPIHPHRFDEGYDAIRDELATMFRWRRPAGQLHDGALEVSEDLVRRLVLEQFPWWQNLPLRRVRSTGTVHALYRLGADMVLRLPLVPRWHSLDKEQRWLPWLAPQLPLAIPGRRRPDGQ
jgi:hypothetical protein